MIRKMSKRTKQLYEYIKAHPGLTANTIMDNIGADLNWILSADNSIRKRDISKAVFRCVEDNGPNRYYVHDCPVYASYLSAGTKADGATVNAAGTAGPANEAKTMLIERRPTSIDDALSALVQALTTSIVDGVMGQVEHRINDGIARAIERAAQNITAPASKVKAKLPRVAVVCLPPQRHNELIKEFSDCLDLRCIGPDENIHMLKSNAASAEHTLVYIDAGSHRHIEACKAAGVEPIVVKGGMTHLREALTKVYVERTS